jgi:hypothetical protein
MNKLPLLVKDNNSYENSFQIFFKNSYGKTVPVLCEVKDTIGFLKEKFFKKEGFRNELLVLTYKGKKLEDRQLAFLVLEGKESTIHTYIPGRGGMFEDSNDENMDTTESDDDGKQEISQKDNPKKRSSVVPSQNVTQTEITENISKKKNKPNLEICTICNTKANQVIEKWKNQETSKEDFKIECDIICSEHAEHSKDRPNFCIYCSAQLKSDLKNHQCTKKNIKFRKGTNLSSLPSFSPKKK